MTLRKVIKQNARRSLKGSFGKAIVILLIVMLVVGLIGALDTAVFNLLGLQELGLDKLAEGIAQDPVGVDYVGWATESLPTIIYTASMTLIELMLIVPLTLGVTNWYLNLSDGRHKGVGDIFWPFGCNAFGKSIWLKIRVFFRVWLFTMLIFILPAGIAAFAVLYLQSVSLNAAAVVTTISAVLMLFFSLLAVVFSMRYAISELLICEKYDLSVGKALKFSVRYTKGHRWELLGLILSFIPWFLTCVLIIPLFYVVPYYTMTLVMYTRYLYEDGQHNDGVLDASDRDSIIIDDISPEKLGISEWVAAQEASAQEAPAQEASAQEASAQEAPAQEAPATKPHKDDGFAEL